MECAVERALGRKNLFTNAIAGCGVGLVTGIKRGPQVSCCASCLVVVCVFELFRFCGVWNSCRFVLPIIHCLDVLV